MAGATGLADADADPGQQQLPEILRHPAESGKDRPQDQSPRDHRPTPDPIGEDTERQAGGGVENRQGHARQKTD